MRKTTFCLGEYKDADPLHGNHTADQRLCFRYIEITIDLLPKSERTTCITVMTLSFRTDRSGQTV